MSTVKPKDFAGLRFAFCFPDTYEIGMSHLGLKVIYELLNKREDIYCQRAFMPCLDMLTQMRENEIELFSLEEKRPLKEFDIVGFTLQYELCYTNILAMLELSGIEIFSKDRGEHSPFIIGGGPCACNPEPVADFFDAFLLGEGEAASLKICDTIITAKNKGLTREQTLFELAKIEGVYVPKFYKVFYKQDGTIQKIVADENVKPTVKKALLKDFQAFEPPTNFAVPMIGAIHDRAQVEVLRGCVRGCRFCQAGFIYRPMRERTAELINSSAVVLCKNTGYEELSLTSLSTSDHSQLEEILSQMTDWTLEKHISLTLPSLRIDNFSDVLAKKLAKLRRTGLTFAPEAGTQRLRNVINKNVTFEEIKKSCLSAFDAGYCSVKLYFMMGLPTETMEDIQGIADTAQSIVDLFYRNEKKQKGKGLTVSVSVSCFVPKPFTPFQFCAQDTEELLRKKQRFLIDSIKTKKVSVSYHDARVSLVEAALAKGDRRLSGVIYKAYKSGCILDGWSEHFSFERWKNAFGDNSMEFYANRAADFSEITPWEHLDYGITKEFLYKEYETATKEQTTQPCNKECNNCGITTLYGGKCFEYN